MIKVLFVCLGNICRSPMAHMVFQNMIDESGLEDEFEIDQNFRSIMQQLLFDPQGTEMVNWEDRNLY